MNRRYFFAHGVLLSLVVVLAAGQAWGQTPSISIAPVAPMTTLPPGLLSADNGSGAAALSGAPAAGTVGEYASTLPAANGVLPNATRTSAGYAWSSVVGTWLLVKKLSEEGINWVSTVELHPDGTLTDSSFDVANPGPATGTWSAYGMTIVLFYQASQYVFDGLLDLSYTSMYGSISQGSIGYFFAIRIDFVPQVVAPATVATSNAVGVPYGGSISITSCTGTDCQYSINGGAWRSDASTVPDNYNVQVRQTSSATPGTTTYLTLTMVAAHGGSNTFSVTSSPATAFYTLTPCRLVDTRNADGPLGGPEMSAGVERSFAVAGECGIPADAKGLALNVTAIGASDAGVLSMMSASDVWNDTSVLHFPAGRARAGNAIVALPLVGGATFKARFTGSGTAHVIIDVTGYFK